MTTYSAMHQRLRNTFGSARDYLCDCGNPAEDWAYQHSADDELRSPDGTTPYSSDPADYMPMCRPCHVQFDMEKDLTRKIRRDDPAFQQEMRDRGAYVGTLKAEMMTTDPEFAARMREASIRGAKTMVKRMSEDPTYGDPIRAVRRANMRVRRRCLDCDLISHPPGMGNHQKNSGHTGWTVVNEEAD